MHRAIQLALQGAGSVAPNPMVGAVLVNNDQIIGEGYHEEFGGPHAEVNCINSVKDEHKALVSSSTLYVTLEPCSHHGKTPPCSDLIIDHKIPKIILGCRDPFIEVNGRGVQKLLESGVEVVEHILERECFEMNRRFFIFHTRKRPYILLKWAKSENGMIAGLNGKRVAISNEYSKRLVHKWRSEESSILVGANTVLADDPLLTTRAWSGRSPIRLVLDPSLKLPRTAHIFDQEIKTIVFNHTVESYSENLDFLKVVKDRIIPSLLDHLYNLNIQSVMVEGGALLLQSFIDAGLWDEARVITNEQLVIGKGVQGPGLINALFIKQELYMNDKISYYKNSTY